MGEVDWERDWLEAKSPIHLIARVGRLGIARSKAGQRGLRLLACALCRYGWDLLDAAARASVEMAERYADDRATEKELARAHQAARVRITRKLGARLPNPHGSSYSTGGSDALRLARAVYWTTSRRNVREIADNVCADVSAVCRLASAVCVSLIRCLLGNPYRRIAIPRAVLTWNGGTVIKLARAINEERRFQDMGILADALEDAGYDDVAVLAHCRGRGPHAHGCHVLDAVIDRA